MTETTTRARDLLRERFEGFLAGRGHEPAWLQKARRDAHATYLEQGLPTRKNENWKYTDLRPLGALALDAAPEASAAEHAARLRELALAGTWRVVLLNGVFHSTLSNLEGAPDGLGVRSLRKVLEEDPESLRAAIAQDHSTEHVFSALNTAYLDDGVVVDVAPNLALERPLEILLLSTGGDASYVAHPRLLLRLGVNSQATIVESHAAAAPGAYLQNVVVDADLADGANLRHLKVLDEADDAFHVAMNRVRVRGRDASYGSNVLAFTGRLVRNDLNVELLAEGAHCDLEGLYALRGGQHVDNHTLVDHRVAHTTSREKYKGVLDGRSSGVFFGRVVVRPDAQKISAEQENNNLVLSDEALVNSTPQLEIYADDVKCAHGSTIGRLDEGQIFYLRSRGLPRETARELLTYAFANEIIDHVHVEPLRERLAQRLTADPQREHIAE